MYQRLLGFEKKKKTRSYSMKNIVKIISIIGLNYN